MNIFIKPMNTAPVQITAFAQQEIIDTLRANKIPANYGLRVGMKGGGCAGQLLLGFDTPTANDQVYAINEIRILIDKRHLMYVINTEIDFEETENGTGFTINKITTNL